MINTHGFVAQLVEQLTLNQLVESSSLSKPTIIIKRVFALFFVANFWKFKTFCCNFVAVN